jgi:hypothetical protein
MIAFMTDEPGRFVVSEKAEKLMGLKSRGGRGHKAENPYERFTASVPPHVLALLDEYAADKGLNRSEMLSAMVERHTKMWPRRKKN